MCCYKWLRRLFKFSHLALLSVGQMNPKLLIFFCSPSWALHNREASVWLVMLGLAVDPSDGLLHSLRNAYPNLRLVTVDLDWLFRGLPTHRLFSSGQWVASSKCMNSCFRLTCFRQFFEVRFHMSDWAYIHLIVSCWVAGHQ